MGAGNLKNLMFMLLVAACGSVTGYGAPSYSVGLNRATIRLGESAKLVFNFVDGLPERDPVLPVIQHLQFHSPSSSRSFSFGGGRSISKTTLSYSATPIQSGDFTIPAITVNMGGKPYTSGVLKLKVLPRAAQLAEEKPDAGLMFARLVVPRTNVYVSEPFRILIKLYFVAGSVRQMPELESDGFTFTDLQATRGREALNGRVYEVFQFPKIAVPVKPGKLKLGPARCPFTARIPIGRTDIFGRQQYQTRQVAPVSNVADVEVLPLPVEGRPDNFDGAVGQFAMEVTVGPTNLTAGDPITLQVAFSGKGVLENVKLPLLTEWNDFKVYPPNSEIEYTDPGNHVGVKRFEQIVVPEKADVPVVPAIEFSYFNPSQKRYVNLRREPTPITVAPAAAGTSSPVIMVTQTNQVAKGSKIATELLHIKPHIGTIGSVAGVSSLALPATTFMAWMLLWIRRRKTDRLENDPRLRRRLATDKLEDERIVELRKQADGGEGEAFFKTLALLLQERIGERLDLPASGITESVISEQMRPAGAADDLCDSIDSLFGACNQARYAPTTESGELMKLANDAEKTLQGLKEFEE